MYVFIVFREFWFGFGYEIGSDVVFDIDIFYDIFEYVGVIGYLGNFVEFECSFEDIGVGFGVLVFDIVFESGICIVDIVVVVLVVYWLGNRVVEYFFS